MKEVEARGGNILAVGSQGDGPLFSFAKDTILIPSAPELAQPFLTAVPMHLLAYWVAVHKGTDVDQPRNLAKSVTVE